MTRNPSIDYVAAKREYVFGEPPPTLSELAEKIGCSRAALAAKAAGSDNEMSWYEEREEFRRRLSDKTLTALADKWASFETANREKRMETANKVLDTFIEALADGKIKITSKDALEWVGLMRQEFEDVRNLGRPAQVIDGEAAEMSEDLARAAMVEVERLLGSGENASPEPDQTT
jgi:uncharacterized protein YdaT